MAPRRGLASRARVTKPRHVDPFYYVDTGCSVAPACLSCPLPRCRYDVPGGARAMLNDSRDTGIRDAYDGGEPVVFIAERLGVSTRTVHRVLESRPD